MSIKISTPKMKTIQVQNSTIKISVKLKWDNYFARKHTSRFNSSQKVVDKEFLRYCSKLVPFKTGKLMESGTSGTVIGSGEIKYTVPYAKRQYYKGRASGQRGRLWGERAKSAHKEDIRRGAGKKLKG